MTSNGLASEDLVLDIYVQADLTWCWKDREDFDVAIAEGVLDETLRSTFEDAAAQVIHDVKESIDAFAPDWREFRPDPVWPVPQFPREYRVRGHLWVRPVG